MAKYENTKQKLRYIYNQNKKLRIIIDDAEAKKNRYEVDTINFDRNKSNLKREIIIDSGWEALEVNEDSDMFYKIWEVDINHIPKKLVSCLRKNIHFKSRNEDFLLEEPNINFAVIFRDEDTETGLWAITYYASFVIRAYHVNIPQAEARFSLRLITPEIFV